MNIRKVVVSVTPAHPSGYDVECSVYESRNGRSAETQHYGPMTADEMAQLVGDLASAYRPGQIFLRSDERPVDEDQPTLPGF